jgi:hypothetical protein
MIKGAFIDHKYTSSTTWEFWIGVIVLYAGSLSLVAFSLLIRAAKFLVDGGVYWASGILANGQSGGAVMSHANADKSHFLWVASVGFAMLDGAATGAVSFALPLSNRFWISTPLKTCLPRSVKSSHSSETMQSSMESRRPWTWLLAIASSSFDGTQSYSICVASLI